MTWLIDKGKPTEAERPAHTPDWPKEGLVKVGIDWGELIPNPRPVVRFECSDGRPGIEIGLKWTF